MLYLLYCSPASSISQQLPPLGSPSGFIKTNITNQWNFNCLQPLPFMYAYKLFLFLLQFHFGKMVPCCILTDARSRKNETWRVLFSSFGDFNVFRLRERLYLPRTQSRKNTSAIITSREYFMLLYLAALWSLLYARLYLFIVNTVVTNFDSDSFPDFSSPHLPISFHYIKFSVGIA